MKIYDDYFIYVSSDLFIFWNEIIKEIVLFWDETTDENGCIFIQFYDYIFFEGENEML